MLKSKIHEHVRIPILDVYVKRPLASMIQDTRIRVYRNFLRYARRRVDQHGVRCSSERHESRLLIVSGAHAYPQSEERAGLRNSDAHERAGVGCRQGFALYDSKRRHRPSSRATDPLSSTCPDGRGNLTRPTRPRSRRIGTEASGAQEPKSSLTPGRLATTARSGERAAVTAKQSTRHGAGAN
jgi:hypothetical protein